MVSKRVLTYELSYELSVDEVQQVAGAGHSTASPSARGSIDMMGNVDGIIDYSWDI